jgi:nuclear GTP-binding protein
MTEIEQEIQLDKGIKLIDSPGIVFGNSSSSDSDIILRNAVKISQVADPIAPGGIIMS